MCIELQGKKKIQNADLCISPRIKTSNNFYSVVILYPINESAKTTCK